MISLGSAQQAGQNMLKCGVYFVFKYLYIHSAWILDTNCIHNFYDVHFMFFVD